MIRVRTGSRLHFGLFSLPSEHAGPWLNQEGEATLPRRPFGGVGLMVDKPGIDLTVDEANTWSAAGPLRERGLRFAQAYCQAADIRQAFRLKIESAAPEHVGLGTGTQLALAVAFALGNAMDTSASCGTVAKALGRGRRSAIGIYGFDFGGFLIEGGKAAQAGIAPLLHHEDFPEDWRIVLVTPRDSQGVYGAHEADAFNMLAGSATDDRATEVLCRLVLLGLLPALVECDLQTFGEALYDFNRRVGAMFQRAQGGVYAHPRVQEIVKIIREIGVRGVGQSSWGPTVFAIVPAQQINDVRDWLIRKGIAEAEMTVTTARNRGAVIEKQFPV